MDDHEALRGALAHCRPEGYPPELLPIFAAARQFPRLMETGETVGWCQVHHGQWNTPRNRCWLAWPDDPCRMVEGVLTIRDAQ